MPRTEQESGPAEKFSKKVTRKMENALRLAGERSVTAEAFDHIISFLDASVTYNSEEQNSVDSFNIINSKINARCKGDAIYAQANKGVIRIILGKLFIALAHEEIMANAKKQGKDISGGEKLAISKQVYDGLPKRMREMQSNAFPKKD